MKRIILIISVFVTLFTMLSCGERNKDVSLTNLGWPTGFYPWYDKGVSAPFCGILNDEFILAGGANFPLKPAADGGKKALHDHIFILKDGQWQHSCKLPSPLAYGGSFVIDNNLYIIGGNNGEHPVDNVLVISRVCDWIEMNTCTRLPKAIEQAGYAMNGHTIYVAGGVSAEGASRSVFTGEVNGIKISWAELPQLPEPLVQPVAMATENRLYVWGGFNPETKEIFTTGWYLDEGSHEWKAIGTPEENAPFVGATAISLPDGRFAVIGGVDKDIFSWGLSATGKDKHKYMTMEPKAYKFNKDVRVFNPETQEWTVEGRAEKLALAGAGLASDGNSLYVIGGEIKPGVRTPQIWKFELE